MKKLEMRKIVIDLVGQVRTLQTVKNVKELIERSSLQKSEKVLPREMQILKKSMSGIVREDLSLRVI